MPILSPNSLVKLETCHPDLQKIFKTVVLNFPCYIDCGHRSKEEQFILFKKGRKIVNNAWVIDDPTQIVTKIDGYTTQSNHQTTPSIAIDVVPWFATPPYIRWKDDHRMYMFAGYVRGIADSMGIKIISGADWDRDTEVDDQTFVDLPHFELSL